MPERAILAVGGRGARARGAVLLEIVLALALFVAAATIILTGLSASLGAARELRLQVQAQDLAVTVLSQVQMGLIPATDAGPNPFEDPALEGWTWQVTFTAGETSLQNASLRRVEVAIVRAQERLTLRQAGVLSPDLATGGGASNAGVVSPDVPPPVSVPVGRGGLR